LLEQLPLISQIIILGTSTLTLITLFIKVISRTKFDMIFENRYRRTYNNFLSLLLLSSLLSSLVVLIAYLQGDSIPKSVQQFLFLPTSIIVFIGFFIIVFLFVRSLLNKPIIKKESYQKKWEKLKIPFFYIYLISLIVFLFLIVSSNIPEQTRSNQDVLEYIALNKTNIIISFTEMMLLLMLNIYIIFAITKAENSNVQDNYKVTIIHDHHNFMENLTYLFAKDDNRFVFIDQLTKNIINIETYNYNNFYIYYIKEDKLLKFENIQGKI